MFVVRGGWRIVLPEGQLEAKVELDISRDDLFDEL